MTVLTSLMHHHHKHCDDLFAAAESAVASRKWQEARALFTGLESELDTHFRSEEEILFPAFEAATGMTVGPTQMMRHEHAQMRHLLEQMHSALGDAPDGEMFAGAAETLLILMQQHNMKEENILYPMCDRSLKDQAAGLAVALQERLAEACPTPR